MSKITVIGKADLGRSHKFGPIVQGQQYIIDEADFTEQLFERLPEPKPAPEADYNDTIGGDDHGGI